MFLNDPKVRGWLYVIGAVLTFAVFIVVAFGLVTSTQIQAGLVAATLFLDGLLQLLARANTPASNVDLGKRLGG